MQRHRPGWLYSGRPKGCSQQSLLRPQLQRGVLPPTSHPGPGGHSHHSQKARICGPPRSSGEAGLWTPFPNIPSPYFSPWEFSCNKYTIITSWVKWNEVNKMQFWKLHSIKDGLGLGKGHEGPSEALESTRRPRAQGRGLGFESREFRQHVSCVWRRGSPHRVSGDNVESPFTCPEAKKKSRRAC